MAELTFKVRRGYQIDPSLTKPINVALLSTTKANITRELASYIDRLNAVGAHILITVEQDGQTFNNKIMGCTTALFSEIMDNIYYGK